MFRKCLMFMLFVPSVLVACGLCQAATYRVGPGETFETISDVALDLEAGDVVLVTGDCRDNVSLALSGTPDRPIHIRGLTRTTDGVIIRPRLKPADSMNAIIDVYGDNVVIEGLDISGQRNEKWPNAAIYQRGENLTLRNCRVHHCRRAFGSDQANAGDVLIEFCEFDANGYWEYPSISLYSSRSAARAVIQHCYFHDFTGGCMLRLCVSRSVVRYNWFQNCFTNVLSTSTVPVDGTPENQAVGDKVLPAHFDIVGNVFIVGPGAGRSYCALSLGGSDYSEPGNEGDFNIAHNLFVTCRGGIQAHSVFLVHGNVDNINLFNNVFLDWGGKGGMLYERGETWDVARTRAFVKKRGHGEPVLRGVGNWISQRMAGVPHELNNSTFGLNPGFVDLVGRDFHPEEGSPLIGAVYRPLPRGALADLVPEFEPVRGIPTNLEPVPRRESGNLCAGPFAVSDKHRLFEDDSGDMLLCASASPGRLAWPLSFADARQKSLRLLEAGDVNGALSWAKMQYLLAPPDEESSDAAARSVCEILKLRDRNEMSATDFEAFATHGERGPDGRVGTDDDLGNPLENVPTPVGSVSYSDFDNEVDLRAQVYSDPNWEDPWRQIEKAYARLENGDFEDAYSRLVEVLPGVARRPASDALDDRALQRNQDLVDRIVAGLTVVARSRTGSYHRAQEFGANCLEFARYGPEGCDDRMGTSDDVDVRGMTTRGPLGAQPPEKTAVQEVVSVDEHVNASQAWKARLDVLTEARRRMLYRLNLIEDSIGETTLGWCAGSSPTPADFYRELAVLSGRSVALLTGLSKQDLSAARNASSQATAAVDHEIVSALASFKDRHASDKEFLTLRAYFTAYVAALHGEDTFPSLFGLVSTTISDNAPPLFLVEDCIRELGDPFLGYRILSSLEDQGYLESGEGKRPLLIELEQTQFSVICRKAQETIAAKDRQPRLYAEQIEMCEAYLSAFSDGRNAADVKFRRAFYEFRAGMVDSATRHLAELTAELGDSPLLPDALFLRALASSGMGDAPRAISQLQELAERFPAHEITPKALFTAGYLLLSEGRKREARDVLLKSADFFPDAEFGKKSFELMGKIEQTGSHQSADNKR